MVGGARGRGAALLNQKCGKDDRAGNGEKHRQPERLPVCQLRCCHMPFLPPRLHWPRSAAPLIRRARSSGSAEPFGRPGRTSRAITTRDNKRRSRALLGLAAAGIAAVVLLLGGIFAGGTTTDPLRSSVARATTA